MLSMTFNPARPDGTDDDATGLCFLLSAVNAEEAHHAWHGLHGQ